MVPDDPDLAEEVERFLMTVSSVNDREIEMVSGSVTQFFALVRRLLLKNYDMPPEEMTALLTINAEQLGDLMSALILHVKER